MAGAVANWPMPHFTVTMDTGAGTMFVFLLFWPSQGRLYRCTQELCTSKQYFTSPDGKSKILEIKRWGMTVKPWNENLFGAERLFPSLMPNNSNSSFSPLSSVSKETKSYFPIIHAQIISDPFWLWPHQRLQEPKVTKYACVLDISVHPFGE